jgi:hypothetical protein
VEQIREHRGRRAGANQPLGLEGLNVGFAEALGFQKASSRLTLVL